jgi:hypothetical protein
MTINTRKKEPKNSISVEEIYGTRRAFFESIKKRSSKQKKEQKDREVTIDFKQLKDVKHDSPALGNEPIALKSKEHA